VRLLDVTFFFQAEVGIRDFHVTGVQTCALPIFATDAPLERHEIKDELPDIRRLLTGRVAPRVAYSVLVARPPDATSADEPALVRSEERRVGKAWRCGGGTKCGKIADL